MSSEYEKDPESSVINILISSVQIMYRIILKVHL